MLIYYRRTTTEQTSNLQTLQAEAGQISSQPQTRDQVFTMLREIRVLQLQVTQLSQASDSNGIPLQRFLEDVSEYADSVFQDADSNGMRIEITQDLDAESDLGNFHSARESFVIPSRPTSQSDPDTTHNFELLPVHTREDAYAQAPAHNFTPPQPIIPPGLLPSTSSLSAHSSWTYTSIRLRISNRLYSFRTASDTTRNILSAVTFLDPAVRAVRLARTQGVLPLAPSQKAWIDQQIAFAEESMDRAAQLVEPARVDLQTRADLRFVRKVQFVLRDSPRIQACFEQLSAAGAGLNAAANLLYGPASTRDGDGDSISTMDIPAPPYSLSLRGEYLG